MVYLPGILLSSLDLFSGAISGFPVKEYWGWSPGKPAYPIVLMVYFSWKIIALIYVGKETVVYLKNAEPNQRNSFNLFLYGITISVILGIASTYISSMIRPKFPEISIIIALLFSIYLTYIIWKFNFFIAPSDTAEDIINLMGDPLIIAGSQNKILRVNNALVKLSGYTEKELITTDISSLLKGTLDYPVNQKNVEESHSFETRLISKKGQSIPVLLSNTVVCNNSKMPVITIIIVKDLTFWHEAQKEFIQAEKLESYEVIVRSIVHDFNNVLASISGHLEIAEISGILPESLKKNVSICRNATSVAINLTKQLAMYAKEDKLDVSQYHISEIIKESSDLALKGSFIKFINQSDNCLWQVKVDRYKIIQVFMNLFINARQAMPNAGTLTVTCMNYLDCQLNKYVKISVQDEGEGIPNDIINKVFNPFFTTKQKGTGLGLYIVKNIIEAHQGSITVESKRTIGTTFTILLPKATEFNGPVVSDASILKNIPEKKILVMDDDESVRLAFSMILSQIGHKVEHAKNGSEAIELIVRAKANEVSFDCVILNLTFCADIGTERAVKRILKIDPQIKTILTSGCENHPFVNDYKSYGFHSVLKKPFNITDVQKAMISVFMNNCAS
jgi:PAS domain S-box-containing protein